MGPARDDYVRTSAGAGEVGCLEDWYMGSRRTGRRQLRDYNEGRICRLGRLQNTGRHSEECRYSYRCMPILGNPQGKVSLFFF
ncbi:uncharacterized protein BT62DRAFT_262707 [Guyanagaster necrorhizus]|uniref:Uncharacterized protein n=1 Tax=Guyanagaster necrorhizus TaxID=856835 RepID=A0A9P7W3X0_9AGAR|nr:uncharacterized protein BT62DRAFT_262707 [Guyanagaster necrorhizus MCA 3950]KAG7451718.1 hypothetical protein BT62DRAFT_262707 [Guyanagaster necrorhizus MCA 3950]